ncbi:hypothetical protein ACXR8U_13755 [Methylobacterium radiotolerans]|jgi:hypothetical protein|uniref:hypothetical protein n=1 Tax=Methylobacterium TaxID=407 RepID=UPI0005DB4599|nr:MULTISPECIES: hypothetical protein [Methylobacterium]MBN6821757.1 hypothetical protein [Methylobacterium organophilum]OXE40257.1 hypothetical protein CCS92_19665 [Methylobacterium radiotolerans]GAN49710.1 virginiamycin B lyase [Methylobacterium sp. ME121]
MIKSVKVASQGGMGFGTRVVDAESGAEVHGVERIAIPEFGADDLIRVELRLALMEFEVEGRPHFQMIDPGSGVIMDVASITFADGTEFKAA